MFHLFIGSLPTAATVSATHTTDALLKAEFSKAHTTDALIKAEFSKFHGTSSLLSIAPRVGSGLLVFEKFTLSGSGRVTRTLKQSSSEIRFLQSFGISGSGSFTSPVQTNARPNALRANRTYLQQAYGWGSVDLTKQYNWADCCPGGEGAHPPATPISPLQTSRLYSVHNFPTDTVIPPAQWIANCPPCTLSADASESATLSAQTHNAQVVEIVHDAIQIKKLKEQRAKLETKRQSQPIKAVGQSHKQRQQQPKVEYSGNTTSLSARPKRRH